jgi:hypothetical protein
MMPDPDQTGTIGSGSRNPLELTYTDLMMFSYSLSLPLLSFQRRYITLASTFAGLQLGTNYHVVNLFPYGSSLGSIRIHTSLKNRKMGDISKGEANTLYPAKKIFNKTFPLHGLEFNSIT